MSRPNFSESRANDGFETVPNSSRRLLLLPLHETKMIWLINGPRMRVEASPAGIVKVFEPLAQQSFKNIWRQVVVRGLTAGKTTLVARDGDEVKARLSITVRPVLNIPTAFHFVGDSTSADHRTGVSSRAGKRQPGDVDSLIQTLNDIFVPQAAIRFQKMYWRYVTVNGNIGDSVVVSSSPVAGDLWSRITSLGERSARFNVFFVRDMDVNGLAGNQGGATAIGGNDCIIEDSEDGVSLAHEAGHALGLLDSSTRKNRLMYSITGQRGQFISRVEADRINS